MSSSASEKITVLLNHPAADDYAALIRTKFPELRVLIAKDVTALDRHMPDADVLLAFRFPVEVFAKATRLKWFQSTGAGVDSIMPIRDRIGDLVVTNARGLHGEIIADFVMAGVTIMHWDFPRLMREQSKREWHSRFVSPLADRTLGIVGLGSIGAAIARRGKSAGMTVVGTKRDITNPVEGVDRLIAAEGLAELLRQSDFVVLAVPHIPATAGMIGRKELKLMRPSASLINIARGSVVVESELVEALQSGTIAGAVLDVFEREPLPPDSALWTMPNVVITPHMAGNPDDYPRRMFEIFGENLERFLKGKPLLNTVDLNRGY